MSFKKALAKFESAPIEDRSLIRHDFFLETPRGFNCCAVGFLTKPVKDRYQGANDYQMLEGFLKETYDIARDEAETLMQTNDGFICSPEDRFERVLNFLKERVASEIETTFTKYLFNLPKEKYRDVAEYFEFSISTVDRWARGISLPAKLIQSQVITYLETTIQ